MKSKKARIRPVETKELSALKKLGAQICELAAKKNKSLERLAYEAGVSKGYLYDVAKGKGNPSVLILLRIASALNISTSHLLDE